MAKLPVIQMYESVEEEAVELTSLLNSSTGTSAMSYNDCNRGISWEQDASKDCTKSCKHPADAFCYVCGQISKTRTKQYSEEASAEMCEAFKAYFGMSDRDQDKPHFHLRALQKNSPEECNSMESEGQHLDKESNKDISKTVVTFDRLIVDTINPTTLHLDWAPCSQCLSVSGYKIRYNIKDNASYNEIFVTPGITSYTVSGLKPNTEYDVCVNAMDQHQRVICSCGNVTQRTDPMMKDKKRYDVPYIAVITAACLLIIAALVPLTFLLLRECVKCDTSMNTSQDKHTSDPLTQPNVMSYGPQIYKNIN